MPAHLRPALVAAGTAALLMAAAPALAQTASTTPTSSPTQAPEAGRPAVAVDRPVIDHGQGHQLVVSGRVGARVRLAAETASPRAGIGTAFRIIREAQLGPHEGDPQSGAFAWSLQPGATTRYVAFVDGTEQRSDTVTVRVRQTVGVGVRQAAGVYTFSGSVARAQPGVQVTVARLDAGTQRVTGVASTRTTAGGRYEVRTRLPAGQAGYYALTSATSDLLAGRSRLYGLVVPPRARPASSALPLSGRVVTLDAGHNGGNAANPSVIDRQVHAGGGLYKACNTVGTSTQAGYPEHAFTFDVTQRAAALLRAQGATVVLTRADDRGVGPCIDRRADIGNRAGSDVVVSVHGDGNLRVGARGFHVITPVAPPVSPPVVAQADRLARQLRQAYAGATGLPYANYVAGGDALDARRDLGGLNLSVRPVVFLECGNMRNREDAAVMSSASGRQRIAAGIAQGVADHLRA